MKHLINIATDTETLSWFENDWSNIQALVNRHGLDGVEICVGPSYPLERIPKSLICGVHLRYFPIWLDFWREDKEALLRQFGSEEIIKHYYGGIGKKYLVEFFKQEFARARALNAKYMVFHVAHVELLDAYTRQFSYTDEDVLEASLEIIEEAFGYEDQGITLLLENLWWPGLRLVDYQSTKDFFERVSYPNKGFVLDISHLMITNPALRTEQEACQYIMQVVEGLKELKQKIMAVHLNKSLPGAYFMEDHRKKVDEICKLPSFWEKLSFIRPHISAIDWHVPFECSEIKQVIEMINPKFLVYELLAHNLAELEEMITIQKAALR
ncbi:MAG: sugar phosphate isomerase/epimerase [Firmicutes bacterium]|nr:sugar phosphate isomerase/epimerase [Bacillota bacterium]